MTDLEKLISEFAAEFESGADPDPGKFLARVKGDQRADLASRLDAYLADSPPSEWDPGTYERSPAKLAVDRVFESLEGVSGTWPELLPHLRHRAELKRRVLVERLAVALGFPDQTERVKRYYHGMEHGSVRATTVSGRVLEALAEIVGTSAEALRSAGARADEGVGADSAATFARTAIQDERYMRPDEPADADAPRSASAFAGGSGGGERRRDELDELFLGPADPLD